MKNFRKIISILIIAVILVTSTAITSFADGGAGSERYTSGDFVYVKYKDGIGIFRYNGKSTSITIPNKLDGYTVTTIEACAFMNCKSLNNIVLPSSVTRIESSAFYDTGYYNNQANWENNVLYIGNFLIEAKPALSGAYKIKAGTKHIAVDAFGNCTKSISVTIPDSVMSIEYCAFRSCEGLINLTIPNSVANIDALAFYGCTGLTNITIPSSVTSIDDSAFMNCTGLTRITVDKSNKAYDSRNNCNAIIETKTNTLIRGCKNTVITSSVTSIGESAFFGCIDLKNVTIPSSVTNIGRDAFDNCTDLKSITIPNSVTSIDRFAFYECSNLKDVYYGGSKADRDKITIESYNYSLLNATWHYNSAPTVTLGDINADGNINSNDALLALQHSVSKIKLTDDKFTAGDVDKNKIINSSDALKILQYAVGQITKF